MLKYPMSLAARADMVATRPRTARRTRPDWQRQMRLGRLIQLTLAAWALAGTTTMAQYDEDTRAAVIEQGRELFVRAWQPYDEQTPEGDGLGPMHNAQSCADCHHQAGVGGGGGPEHNVDLLILFPPEKMERLGRDELLTFIERVGKIHAGLISNQRRVLPAITLHKFGGNPAYDDWRTVLLMLVDHLRPGSVPERIGFGLAQRSTPALFGAGLIDAIPDRALEVVARRQSAAPGAVKGKLALATDGGVGKFGWRGQTSTLKQFVLGACANELGLNVPTANQPVDPLDPAHKSPGLDLDRYQCDRLVAYVASLPPPGLQRPTTDEARDQWVAGSRLFKSIGCAECHVAKLGNVTGIFSDLLLHDMGSALADRAAANPPGVATSRPSPGSSGLYYGGPEDIFATVPPETMRQWRTPPLWGVADSGPYMHDGRALTLDDAILQHDGEGRRAKRRYAALTIANRRKLLVYVESLGYFKP